MLTPLAQSEHSIDKNKLPFITLDDVKCAFMNWRRDPKKSWYIPDVLWNKVIGLLPHYPKKQIANALAINHAQLEKKIKQPQPCSLTKTKNSFVKAVLPATASLNKHDVLLTRPNGATLKIQQLHSSDLSKLIEQFCELSS